MQEWIPQHDHKAQISMAKLYWRRPPWLQNPDTKSAILSLLYSFIPTRMDIRLVGDAP